jgi:hypothetical protein
MYVSPNLIFTVQISAKGLLAILSVVVLSPSLRTSQFTIFFQTDQLHLFLHFICLFYYFWYITYTVCKFLSKLSMFVKRGSSSFFLLLRRMRFLYFEYCKYYITCHVFLILFMFLWNFTIPPPLIENLTSHGSLQWPSNYNSMGRSPSWEANRHSSSQEFTHLLWNLKVNYHVHKSLPLVPILSHIYPFHTISPCFSKIRSFVIFTSVPRFYK